MPRFFTESIESDIVSIVGQDARHIALSLRMKTGDDLILCDGKGYDATCKLSSISPDFVEAEVVERYPSRSEPKTKVTLYMALPKFDKFEYVVQKSVELGVTRIVPVLTSRCISRPDEKTIAKKTERMQKISDEAAKQSGRGILPEVGKMLSFKQALKEMSTYDLPIMFYEHAEEPLEDTLKCGGTGIAVFVGSEGGFSEEEAAEAKKQGIHITSLGPRILRCETAPIAGLSAIMFGMGEMK